MNILFLTSQIPNYHSGATIRPFHVIKNFSKEYNYNIFLISFVNCLDECYVNNIREYCQEILLLPLKLENNEENIALNTFKNVFSLKNIAHKILSKNGVFDPSYYNQGDIQKKIDNFLEQHSIDAIYTDAGMAGYVANSRLPKIVEPLDINYKNWFHYFIENNKLSVKVYWLIRCLQTFYRETRIYNKFDFCIVVTESDKNTIDKYLSNVVIIPNGVDIDYFRPLNIEPDHPSLVFSGVMNGEKNVEAVLYFNSKIYPLIKKEYPNIRFYIVGKNPTSQICKLSKEDSSIIVTGFVEDLRHYISKSSVFICPHISGSGIKNKVLEAMSMGKPVVTTPIGILGINATQMEDVIIAKSDKEFSTKIIELLGDKELRERIGYNARQLIISSYSWEHTVKKINFLFNLI